MNIKHPDKQDYIGLITLWQEAFGDSEEFIHSFFNTAFSPDRSRCITENDTVIAALYWFDCLYNTKKIAYIYAVATAVSHRGKGICNTLMKDTHTLLEDYGYDGIILVPGNKSLFDFYRKMGYKACSNIKEFECDAAETVTTVTKISKEEYSVYRRKFLPENSVIQENENMEFLSAQATFYKGNGFILAARGEKETLFGIELLGNVSAAPEILKTLDFKKGFFRTHGDGRPFTMYMPLKGSTFNPPSYFGLAFD